IDVAARGTGALWLCLAAGGGMDCEQIGIAADQYLRAGDVLSDVSPETNWHSSFEGMPDVELRAGRFIQAARAFMQEAGTGCARAWSADDGGWGIYGGVCGVPGELRDGAGDDVQ